MILSDCDLKRSMKEPDGLRVSVLYENSMQPASIDLHLGREFVLLSKSREPRDIFDEDVLNTFNASEFTIFPGRFLLATTEESVYIPPSMTAFIEGRSSIGRKGLFIHNAGYIDPGFSGQITLELYNCSARPLILHAGMSICQMVVSTLSSPVDNPYSGRYQNQQGTTVSRLHFDKTNPEPIPCTNDVKPVIEPVSLSARIRATIRNLVNRG